MQTSLEILPKDKQEELHRVVEIIRGEFEPELTVQMIILFGSHARGSWVEDAGISPNGNYYTYRSDFDIYVLMSKKKHARRVNRRKSLRDKLRTEIKTPVHVISDSVNYFNKCLKEDQYFFTDIKKEGIMLYTSGQYKIAEPRNLTVDERRKKAEEDFDFWYKKSNEYFDQFQNAFNKGNYATAAFELHQTVERLYSTVTLVLTNYKPRGHDLDEYGGMAASQAPILHTVFPRDSKEDERRYQLLKKAYVDARYNKNYQITKEELEWLAERVKNLQALTEDVCKKWIESLKAKSEGEYKGELIH
jgi:HEPN domain-containing protein/predicted nucleotidyltransferase